MPKKALGRFRANVLSGASLSLDSLLTVSQWVPAVPQQCCAVRLWTHAIPPAGKPRHGPQQAAAT